MLLLALASVPLGATAAGAFVTDANSFQAWDASARQGESVTWSGACKDGKAGGEGRFERIVDGKLTSSEKGLFHEGRLNRDGRIEWTNPHSAAARPALCRFRSGSISTPSIDALDAEDGARHERC
jgi:hypothetical protein